MPEAVIVSAVRTPVGRAYKGSLRATRPDDLAALAIKEALARVPGLDAKEIDDVILGCAMPEGEQGMNVARIAALRAGLPVETSAMTINRFCSSGLQAIALAGERIRAGSAEVIVAGGTESMSMVPMGGNKISPNPWLVDNYPDAYINMGLGTENIARKFGITREQADQFSAASHKKALAAIAAGNFKDETIPVEVKITALPNGNGASSKAKSAPKPATQTFVFATDELPRADTSLDVLAKPPGAPPFKTLWERADRLDAGGFVIRVASIDDLLAMKRAAGRPKDLADIAELEAILRLRAEPV